MYGLTDLPDESDISDPYLPNHKNHTRPPYTFGKVLPVFAIQKNYGYSSEVVDSFIRDTRVRKTR